MRRLIYRVIVASVYLLLFGGGRGNGGFRVRMRQPQRRQQGNTPVNNRDQNRQFADAIQQLRREGIHLDKDKQRELHNAISRQGLSFWEIVEIGRAMFGTN